jgi:hypothetical protein
MDVLLAALPYGAGDYNIGFNDWQAAATAELNPAANGQVSASEAIRRAADAINNILKVNYPTP